MSIDRRLFGEDQPRSLSLDGLALEVLDGWEARMRRAAAPEQPEETFPVVHAATVPLSSSVADYGGGAVERLGPDDIFISLVEFGSEAIGSALFPEVDEIPSLHPNMFHPNQLQRRIRGQGGKQVFFTLQGRAFCLYVVVGSHSRRANLAGRANQLIRRLEINRR